MSTLEIRPFETGDEQGLYRVAADTAFFGKPVETFMDDRRLFCDLVYRYYVVYEPEHAWVAATSDTAVVGFLTGCVSTQAHDAALGRRILPFVLGRLLRGKYRLGRRTWSYILAAAGTAVRHDIAGADLARYPAHLHINLAEASRGHGAGRRLMTIYLDQLRALGLPGVHLRTTNRNEAAIALYLKLGFRLLAACPTHMWARYADEPVESHCYGLEL